MKFGKEKERSTHPAPPHRFRKESPIHHNSSLLSSQSLSSTKEKEKTEKHKHNYLGFNTTLLLPKIKA